MGVGIGMVGAGGMACGALIPYFRATGQAETVAIYDPNLRAAHRAAEQYGIAHVCETLDELLADQAVQAVCIASPNAAHREAALAALAAGKHVFCEKPLADTLAAARAMAAAAQQAAAQHGLIDVVNFSYRGYPAVRFIRDLLLAGDLGDIRHLYMFYALDDLMDPQAPMIWRMQAALAGAGPLADIGAHLIDMTRYLSGEITALTAHLHTFVPQRPNPLGGMAGVDVDDAASLLCSMQSGAMAALHVTGMGGGWQNHQRVELYGTHGSLIYEIENQQSLQMCFGPAGFRHHAWSTVAVPPSYKTGDHGAVQRAFVTSVLAGKRIDDGLCPSFADGLRCQEVLDAALNAMRSRAWVDIPGRAE